MAVVVNTINLIIDKIKFFFSKVSLNLLMPLNFLLNVYLITIIINKHPGGHLGLVGRHGQAHNHPCDQEYGEDLYG